MYKNNIIMENTYTRFGDLVEHQFFILEGLTLCKFGKYGFGLNGDEKFIQVIDPETLVNKIELKEIFNKKKK
ncbi:MAG: hypothetical protein K9I82_01405 [Chitinophagaceae bacterium]|nr:hypothetical protein [Chitinophagaceae bacterium]